MQSIVENTEQLTHQELYPGRKGLLSGAGLDLYIARGVGGHSLVQNELFRLEWKALCRQCAWATPFQEPDFVSIWYDIYRSQFDPVLVYSFDTNNRLTGLLPLAVSSKDRHLVVAGDHHAEYQGWVCQPELNSIFPLEAIKLIRRTFPTPTLKFQYLPSGMPVECFNARETKQFCILENNIRPLMKFEDGEAITRSLRKKSNKSRINRLKQRGPVDIVRISNLDQFEEIFDEIIDYYDFHHSAVYNIAPFRNDNLKKTFYQALFSVPDLLHVSVLRAGDTIAAALLGISSGMELQLGIIAYNPSLGKHSPGKYLILLLAQLLIKEGFQQLDLTPGNESYKERFANTHEQVHTLTVFSSSISRNVIRLLDFGKEIIKKPLRSVRIEPSSIRGFANGLSNRTSTHFLSERLQGLSALVPRSRILRIYSYELAKISRVVSSVRVQRNSLGKLLDYLPRASQRTIKTVLNTTLFRLEEGQQFYSITKNGQLVAFGWSAHSARHMLGDELWKEFPSSTNSVIFYDFYWASDVNHTLCKDLLQTMLCDASQIQGEKKAYINLLASDLPYQTIAESLGFAFEGSLCEKVRLGKRSRLSTMSDFMIDYSVAKT